MRFFAVCLFVLSFVGCKPPTPTAVLSDFRYMKDCRTDLCFSYKVSGYNGFLAAVPCEKAQSLLENTCSGLSEAQP